MTIQIDSREKKKAIQNIVREFDRQGVQYFVSKVPFGDYIDIRDGSFAIDRKQNLLELCSNVCQDHKRFVNEIERARQYGIRLVFLIEHGEGIRSLEDVKDWQNPRLAESPLAVSGQRLYTILSRLEATYGTKFYFCDKHQTGRGIIKLLKMNMDSKSNRR